MKSFSQDDQSVGAQIQGNLVRAQAEYLKANLYIANVGTTSVILLLGYFFWGSDLANDLIPWISMGLLGTTFRAILMFVYRSPNCFDGSEKKARKYLYLYTVATLISGATFGYGWLSLVPHLSSYEQLIYLLSIVALLFGGLFAYSPYFPAYIGFSSTSLWLSPLLLDFTSEIYVAGLAFGIWLISLVSTMFAYRFSNSFKTNRELQLNIYQLLEEVTKKRDEAIAANLAKTRFLASVSHDLRQPMQAVSLSISTLQQLINKKFSGANTQQSVEENFSSLQHSVTYLNAMFEALLDISRLEAGALNIRIEFREIETLLKNLEFEYIQLANQDGLQFELIKPNNLSKLQVKVDIHLFERLLRNLISNAIRYTQKGGVRLAVRLKGDSVDIRVIDTGPGIRPDMREKIFDEFVQIRNTNYKNKVLGMGLGLSISKRLSGLLGTRIRLHTHEDMGTVFAFKLPVRKKSRASVEALSKPNDDPRTPSIEGLFLVVIDDDSTICKVTKNLLELHGAEVIAADSGDAAIQSMIFSSKLPDLILSDYRLQGETGLECINKIRDEFNYDIPAVIVTGDTAPHELNLLKEAGMEVLYKPVDPNHLLMVITRNIKPLSTVDEDLR